MVHLTQGQVLDVGICGVVDSSTNDDTYLRLIDSSTNIEVASNDDACGGHGSRITYTATRTGPHEVRLGCSSALSCSGALAFTRSGIPPPSQMLPSGFVNAKSYLEPRRPTEAAGERHRRCRLQRVPG
ncbi:hypothetical protein DRW03_14430 [Corallococcus sp. H22C18031201]|nr:hypothetical protein DRW03_14430 [Corallococcus sp. H22C18031201]